MEPQGKLEDQIDRGAEKLKKKVRVVRHATQLLKSRTVRFSIILSIVSMLQGFLFTLPLTPMHQMGIGIGISIFSVVLRVLTKQPLSEL